jgi:hypothetical protein
VANAHGSFPTAFLVEDEDEDENDDEPPAWRIDPAGMVGG